MGSKVYDIDPFVVTLDASTSEASATGCIAYHQDFTMRTSQICGYKHLTKQQTVTALRMQLVTGRAPLQQAPDAVANALNHMTGIFGKMFNV